MNGNEPKEQTGKPSKTPTTPPKRVRKSVERKILEMKNQMKKLDEHFDDMQENPRRERKPEHNQAREVVKPPKKVELPPSSMEGPPKSGFSAKKPPKNAISPAKEAPSSSQGELGPSTPPSLMIKSLPPKKNYSEPPAAVNKLEKTVAVMPKRANIESIFPTISVVRERVNQIEFNLSMIKKDDCSIPEMKTKYGMVKAKLDRMKAKVKEMDERHSLHVLQMKQKMMILSECREMELSKQCDRVVKSVTYVRRTKTKMANLESSMLTIMTNRRPSGPFVTFGEMLLKWWNQLFSLQNDVFVKENALTWHALLNSNRSSECNTEKVVAGTQSSIESPKPKSAIASRTTSSLPAYSKPKKRTPSQKAGSPKKPAKTSISTQSTQASTQLMSKPTEQKKSSIEKSPAKKMNSTNNQRQELLKRPNSKSLIAEQKQKRTKQKKEDASGGTK